MNITLADILYIATAVIASLGGGAVIVFAFSSWLGKVWAERILEKQKADLQKLMLEHEVRFSRLHEKRALLITELYEKLRELDYGVRQVRFWMGHPLTSKERVAKASLDLTHKYVAARQHFERNQLYFDPAICKKLREIIEISSDISDEYFVWIIDKDSEQLKAAQEFALKVVEKKAEAIDSGLKAVEDHFRLLLGVTDR